MRTRVDRLWRLLRTGLGFVGFGVVVLLLAFVVIPLDRRLVRSSGSRELRAQQLIHRGARLILEIWRRLGVMRVEVVHAARLHDGQPRLVVSNHPTLFDFVVLASLMPQADCIVNGARAENPILRRLLTLAGYVRSDDGVAVVRSCLHRLEAGRSIVIFPEGTRSPAGGLGEFRPGAALLALISGRELLPVLLTCEPQTLKKGQSWYDVPERALQVRVRAGEPILPTPGADRAGGHAQAARRLTAELREFFLKGLDIADVGRA
jgi:1-acyl-sn-glycerol-3-phosphate acyltransferase